MKKPRPCRCFAFLETAGGLYLETLADQTYEPVIGVDIGPDAIRVVEMERIGREYYLRNFGIAPTPQDSMQDGHIVKPREVGRVLRTLFQERRFSPAMPHDRLRRLIESEIDRYVLFGNEDKIVYYHPLEEFEEQGRRRVAIMLVIAERNLCFSYFQALEAAGLECQALDLSSFAILRVLHNSEHTPATQNILSLAYDYQGISMNVFHGDTIRFSRTVKLSRMDPQEMQNGFLDKILSEIMLAMHFYQTEYARGGRIHKMVLSLGAAGGMDLYHMLAEHIDDVPIEMHSPFANIKVNVDEFPSELMDQVDLSFLTAVGLAFRGLELERLPFSVDLLPTEIGELRQLKKSAFLVAMLLIVITAATVFAWFLVHGQARNQLRLNQALERTYQAQQHDLDALRPQAERLKGLPSVDASHKITIPVNTLLMNVSEVVPKNVQLEELHAEQDAARAYSVSMTGFTVDPAAIKDFSDYMHKHFDAIEKSAVTQQQINEISVNRFTISGRWKEQP